MKRIEISLRELATYVTRKWFVIALIAIALTMAYLPYVRQRQNHTNNQLKLVYEQELKAYQTAIDASASRTKSLMTQKQDTERYLTESIIMGNDSFNYPFAVLSIDISTSENNTILSRIRNHYLELAKSAPLLDILKGIVPDTQNEGYLREAIKVTGIDSDIISIEAIGNEHIDALRVVDAIAVYLESHHETVTASAGTHTLTILNREASRGADRLLVDQRTKLENLLANINKLLASSEYDKPIEPIYSRTNISSAVLVSSVAGIVIGILMVLIMYYIRIPIQYPEQPMAQLGIRYIGDAPQGTDDLERMEKLEYIAAMIKTARSSGDKVVIIQQDGT